MIGLLPRWNGAGGAVNERAIYGRRLHPADTCARRGLERHMFT